MGKQDCQEYSSISDAIKINAEAANAVRRLLEKIPRGLLDQNPDSTYALQTFVSSHQGANVELRGKHEQDCRECQKGE